jgi:pimeloyl-ACP methyl ester carboxylesterase
MPDYLFAMRTGRKLEVREYGDPGGHAVFFFHGLIGSHYQASYVADQAREHGLRIIAPNRPGVGASEFVERTSALDVIGDVEDHTSALRLATFSVIGISGGAPYALATLLHFKERVRTVTLISGMGPSRLAGALAGMDRRRRLALEIGSRFRRLARQGFEKAAQHFQTDHDRFLAALISTWSRPDQKLFERRDIYELFMKDLHQVFTRGSGALGLAQELTIYRNYGFSLRDLPADRHVVLWHGLADNIVPPAMAWRLTTTLKSAELHLVPGGHFVAVEIAGQIMARLRQELDKTTKGTAPDVSGAVAVKDYFSGHADCYQASRPNYPPALFEYLASLCPRRELAWDCATGNGQAAVPLAGYFSTVLATDVSRKQVDQGRTFARVRYVVAAADRAPITTGSVDLVTVAQALHWFDLPKFYNEVARVARSGSIVAVWCYEMHSISPEIDRIVQKLYSDIVGPDWPPERRLVEEGYRTLPFPFEELAAPAFEMKQVWDLNRVLGYFASWSATQRYRARTGTDPLELIRPELAAAWGDPSLSRDVIWPLNLRIGRVSRPTRNG